MKIGVVVTCKDAWHYTEACLPTLVSAHDLFICVVDDGCTDGTKKGLKKWQSEDKANRWVFTDPPFDSLAAKWNLGIDKCWSEGCDYVLVSNNDVLYHPTTIDRLADRVAKGDVVMATAHNIQGQYDADGFAPEDILMCSWPPAGLHPEAECPDFSGFLISRECWDKVGKFDDQFKPAYFEDNDYHERIVRAGLKAVNLPSAPYYHYGSVTQDHDKTPDPLKHRRFEATRERFYRKWGFVPHGGAVRGNRKLKLMVIGDGHRETGFARVVHSVLERLAATGDYDIHHLAINYQGDPVDVPWRMYPAHLSNPPELFGRGRVQPLYDDLKPDAVWMVQDPWHISDYVRSNFGMRGLVAYYPIDAPNMSPAWIAGLSRCVELCTYTQFGADESAVASETALNLCMRDILDRAPSEREVTVDVLKMGKAGMWRDPRFHIPMSRLIDMKDPSTYNVVPHGVDSGTFYQVGQAPGRERFNMPADWFIVGYVHRNQPRKRQDAMIRTFAKFLTGERDPGPRHERFGPFEPSECRQMERRIHNAGLVIHAPIDDLGGWDLTDLVNAYGIADRVMFTRPDGDGVLPVEHLNELYNAFDVNANLGGGEGWGLSHIESGACGVAQMVPDWSATGEIWTGYAELLPVVEVQHMTDLNTMQACVDTDAAADVLQKLYDDRALLEERKGQALEVANRADYQWDSVAARFDAIIKRAAELKGIPAQAVTIHRKPDEQKAAA